MGGRAATVPNDDWIDVTRTWTAPGKEGGDIAFTANGMVDLAGMSVKTFEDGLIKKMVKAELEIRAGAVCGDGVYMDDIAMHLVGKKEIKPAA